MKTRNSGKYEKGQYLFPKKQNFHIVTLTRKPCFKEISKINYEIIKTLKLSSKKSPTIRRSIEISNRFQLFVSKQFQVACKFKKCDSFLNYFNIVSERFYPKNSCKQVDYAAIRLGSFEMKLSKAKQYSYINRKLETAHVLKKSILFFKFIKENKKI